LQRAFDLEVGIVGLTSGWATHRYTMRQRDNTSEPFSRGFVVFSYVLVLLLIFTMSLHYFAFLNALRNVPS
jgi:hypothetical protein